jgi:hypothetical protein
MKRRDLMGSAFVSALLPHSVLQAQVDPLPYSLLDKAQGRAVLRKKDVFLNQLTGAGRSWRMKVNRTPSVKEYLDFVEAQVLAWSSEEAARLSATIERLKPIFAALNVRFPWPVSFIRTTDKGEAAPHTRMQAVVLTTDFIRNASDEDLFFTLAHELWHVYSRAFETTRDEAYALINYRPLRREIKLSSDNQLRRQTNPDAPELRFAIELTDQEVWSGAPGPHYLYGRPYFQVLSGGRPKGQVLTESWVRNNTNFWSLVTRNTSYIIHPEEHMADNFAMLVTGRREPQAGPQGTQLIEDLRTVLALGPR